MIAFRLFQQLVQNKDEEITRLRNELKELKQSYDDISSFCEESIATASVLEQKTEELKVISIEHVLIKVPIAADCKNVCLLNTSKSHSYHVKIW